MTARRLHLVEHGSGIPVLVLPGLTFPGVSWAPLWERARPGHHWLALDLPGHGLSAAWDVVRPVELAHALAEEVQRRGLPPPLVVGHSYGALVAAVYAGHHPVSGLVTVDQRLDAGGLPLAGGGLPQGGASEAAPRLLAAIESSLRPEVLGSQVAARLGAVQQLQPHVLVPYLRALEEVTVHDVLAPVLAGLKDIRVPWVDVHRDDPGQAHRARVAAGRASVQVWQGSSHCMHLEHPDRFTRLLASVCVPAR